MNDWRCFIDVETTGLDPDKHGIIQIAGKIYKGEEFIEHFEFLPAPAPGDLCNKKAMDFHGLTVEELKETHASPYRVWAQFDDLLKKYIKEGEKYHFLAYNARFDEGFIRAFCKKLGGAGHYSGEYFHFPPIDIMCVAATAVMLSGSRKSLGRFKLLNAAKFFNIVVDESRLHDALYDIDIAIKVWEEAIKMIGGHYAKK